MSEIDIPTWNPDPDLNKNIGGIPLNESASIGQTWYAIQMLMAAAGKNGLQLVPFTGATSQEDGSQGFVPAPEAGDEEKFLKGDGTWDTPIDTTYEAATQDADGLMSASDKAKLDGIGNVFTFCGSVADTSSLPLSGNTAGDVYAVENPASVYAWDGSAWVELGFDDVLVPISDAQIDSLF